MNTPSFKISSGHSRYGLVHLLPVVVCLLFSPVSNKSTIVDTTTFEDTIKPHNRQLKVGSSIPNQLFPFFSSYFLFKVGSLIPNLPFSSFLPPPPFPFPRGRFILFTGWEVDGCQSCFKLIQVNQNWASLNAKKIIIYFQSSPTISLRCVKIVIASIRTRLVQDLR